MSVAMSSLPFRIVGFDLDGTLVDTSPDLAAAVNAALAHGGLPPLAEDIRPMIGGGSRLMLRRGLAAAGQHDEALVDRLLPVLLDYYHAHIADGSRPYPGLLDALDMLAADGVTLAVVTNKLEALATRLLDALGMSARFATVIGGDSVGRCKPDPAPIHAMVDRCGGGRAAFVGDSIFDVAAARAAGLPSVAVSFGFLDRPVQDLGADRVIDHYDALLPALRALGHVPDPCAA